jgi:predicted PurR-regulated permease PerM
MENSKVSPPWNNTTKLVVGITFVAIVAGLLIKFQGILPPLILSFTLVYMLYPLAALLNKQARFSWRLAVSVVYIVLFLVLLAALALTGLELGQQMQSLINLVESSLEELPGLVQNISTSLPTHIGPFPLDFSALDLSNVSTRLIDTLQQMLGRTGEIVGAVASGAFNTFGWAVFVLLISYFILSESGGLREGILPVEIPGYAEDIKRMGKELGRIWNAFLRGQLILIGTATIIYTFVLSMLGVHYALGLALMAGMARFLPYVGPAISWTVLALVSFFQAYKPLGLSPLVYTLIVLAFAWVIDGILDNLVSPRIMAESLKVHPAAVLVAAIIALDLLGILGVVIAAPILATFQLVGHYFVRKMFDLDPWEGLKERPTPPSVRQQVSEWVASLRKKFKLRRI